ncbi:unnamed protein product [Clonostachys chloroleuca]|uniref:2-oxoisovalerate dehydrogenase subunit alpha n=1 Tax=Clonostachys chloroleuca TaxID=1926264 RepID=A0AA35PVJ2_9HYPO|nr:unnamed protein product [Clonostachys chloroleuca]
MKYWHQETIRSVDCQAEIMRLLISRAGGPSEDSPTSNNHLFSASNENSQVSLCPQAKSHTWHPSETLHFEDGLPRGLTASNIHHKHLDPDGADSGIPETELDLDRTCFQGSFDSPFSSKTDRVVPDKITRISTYRVLNRVSRIEDPAQSSASIPPEGIVKWYENMVTVNIIDTIMSDAQRHGRLSFYMVSHGEEGLMVGSAVILEPGDVITRQYYEHGVFLQRGFEPKDFMSQLAANANDPGYRSK